MATPTSSSSATRSPVSTTPQTYRLHVSQKYLDLTKQKLDLVRLPKEPPVQDQWSFGVAKNELESLVDHWMENYDWRAQELFFNDTLPQFRVRVNGIRVHYVHRRSPDPSAIPLLFVHGWPESFISISHMIDALCQPIATSPHTASNSLSFHVVAPSIPGFAFTEPVSEDGNNYISTAEVFNSMMKALGYNQYIAHGSGWGFKICRMLALNHPENCIALHTVNIETPPPPQMNNGFGFPQQSLAVPGMMPPADYTPPNTPNKSYQPIERPQTMAYALCDSPTGLLAYILDAIRPSPPIITTDNSPRQAVNASSPPAYVHNPWSPTAIINLTMFYWLPGPETPLRWLANSMAMLPALWATTSPVPIAISQYVENGAAPTLPPWIDFYHQIAFVRRRPGVVRFAAWERPMDMVMDLRELAALVAQTVLN